MSTPTPGQLAIIGQLAIGPRDGDYLKLENQWARVAITLDRAAGQPDCYIVTGDILEFRNTRKEFRTVCEAIHYAMRSLALFQEGRAS
jgi:hypothetical protein